MQNQVRYDNLWLRNRFQPIFQLFVTEDLSFDQYVNTCQLYGQPTRRDDGEYLCHELSDILTIFKNWLAVFNIHLTCLFFAVHESFPFNQ